VNRLRNSLSSWGHNIHTNKTQQPAFKYNTLFGHYREIVYNGLNVKVISGFSNIEGFEKMSWYMQSVGEEVIAEAIGKVEGGDG
jgi:hypothetical protein